MGTFHTVNAHVLNNTETPEHPTYATHSPNHYSYDLMSGISNLSSFGPSVLELSSDIYIPGEEQKVEEEEEIEEEVVVVEEEEEEEEGEGFEDPALLFDLSREEEAAAYPPEDCVYDEHEFSDELEAVQSLRQEQKEKWDREGVVIRGNTLAKRDLGFVIAADNRKRKAWRDRTRGRFRIKGGGEVRSSSIPPDSPTPFHNQWTQLDQSDLNSSTVIPSSSLGIEVDIQTEVDEVQEKEEEEELSLRKGQPHPISLHFESSIGVGSDIETEMDTDEDAPDSTMLVYPSSPPETLSTPPRAPKQQSKPMGLGRNQPFSYADSDSDGEDARNGIIKASMEDNIFGKGKTLELPSRPIPKQNGGAQRRLGPFQEADDDDEEEGEVNSITAKDKGKGRAHDVVNDTADTFWGDHSDLYSQPNKPPSLKPTSRASKQLPFSYEDEDAVPPSDVQELESAFAQNPYCGAPGLNTVPVLLISGKTLHIKRKPPKRYITTKRSEVTYDDDGNRELKDSYYGVEIHKLFDGLQAEKAVAEYGKEKAKGPDAGIMQVDAVKKPSAPPPARSRQQRCMLWTEKYRAKRFTDLLGDERTHRQVLRWLKQWDNIVFPGSNATKRKAHNDTEEDYFHKKVLLITGPPGLGKTTLAHVASRQAGYEPLEVNASDDRTAGVVKGKIRDALSNEGVRIPGAGKKKGIGSSRPACIIVDEIDGVSGGGGEAGFMNALVELILQDQKNSFSNASGSSSTASNRKKRKPGESFRFHRPIIAICNDLYAPSLRALRPLAEIVYMRKPPTSLIISRMKWVFDCEGVPAEENAIRRLVELSTSGSAAQAASGGGGGGDMRGCLVSGEWVAKRLSSSDSNSSGVCGKLTRKVVEEEMEGASGSASSRGGVRGCVERVFRKNDNAGQSGAARGGTKLTGVEARKREWESLREEVECCGEFDKIITNVFSTYLTRPYHDDTLLSKPNLAYDWLYFHDLVSGRVFSEQEYELSSYLAMPPLAFNSLFGCSAATAIHNSFLSSTGRDGDEEKEPPPFQGPKADYDHLEGLKVTKTIIQSIHTNLFSSPTTTTTSSSSYHHHNPPNPATPAAIRFATQFHSTDSIVSELAPYLTRILAPRVNPILIHGSASTSSTSSSTFPSTIASVRKDSEKRLVRRAVEVMYSANIHFEKVRVEFSSNPTTATTAGTGGWAYRMEPPLDQICSFPTFNPSRGTTGAGPTRYATRQVLSQELHKYGVLQRQAIRDARVAKLGLDAAAALTSSSSSSFTTTTTTKPSLPHTKSLKRDFFGRVVEDKSHLMDIDSLETDPGLNKRCKRDESMSGGGKVWVSFHDGYSNAVKKGITLEDMLGGLY